MSVNAQPPCHSIPWDSGHFGFPVARVEGHRLTAESARDVDAWCREHRIRCAYFLADLDDHQTLRVAQAQGFVPVDLRMSFEKHLAQAPVSPEAGAGIRPAVPGDLPALCGLARQSYVDSRFYFDPGFGRDKADELYVRWVENCFRSGETFFVAEEENRLAGYLVAQLTAAAARISLLGVAPQAQGRGLGRRLVEAALRWLEGQAARRVGVITQGRNLRAQRLYQRCGFVVRQIQLWHHRWFEPV